MEDNKDLLNEIDKLDDNDEVSEEKEKSTSHEKAFTVVIVIIIIAALVMFYLSYKGNYIVSNKENKQDDFSAYLENVDNNEEDSNPQYEEINFEEQENQKREQFEAQKNNIVVTSQVLDIDSKLIATIHNGNQESIENILVQVIFYNGEDKPIKIDQNIICMLDGENDYYLTFKDTPKGYERCDFLISKDNYYNIYESRKNDISFDLEEKDADGITRICAKNNSDNRIKEINFAVIYYNENNQIIAIREQSEYDIKKQKEFKIKLYTNLYSYETYEEVPYSRFEVVLLDAISYTEN